MQMSNLIPINYDNERPTVLGRQLYDFLEVDTNYTTWFKRMTEYGFTENTDYITCLPNLESENHGGQNKQDHQLTIEMAKELCMIQRTEKGKQARQYFIELEKQWNSPEAVFARALKMAERKMAALQGNIQELEQTIESQKPMVLFAETCIASNDSILVRELAKLASKNGIIIGEKRLYQKLREWDLILQSKNEPSQKAMDMGLFEVKKVTYNTPYGSETWSTTKVSPKGQIYIIEKLKKG
jgi:anti-repressor protein